MDIKYGIKEELWQACKDNYERGNYTGDILDGMHFLTETIRNKSGLDIEGVKLAEKAFGGEHPKIRINNLHTASEKDSQRGIKEILKGFFIAVRNPRSYDNPKDSKEECDGIIIFIDYLLKIIDKSKLGFEENTFLKRVFDNYYVKSKEYSDLLVSEIPRGRKVSMAISVLQKRNEGDIDNLALFMASLLENLDEKDIKRVYSVVSEQLKYTTDEKDIKTILKICPGKYWSYTNKAVKMRVENILLSSVAAGRYNKTAQRCIADAGLLGSAISKEYLQNFEDLGEWTKTIVIKLAEGSIEEQDYIDAFFWDNICEFNKEDMNSYLRDYISQGLTNGYVEAAQRFMAIIYKDENHPWRKEFEKELNTYKEIAVEEEVEE